MSPFPRLPACVVLGACAAAPSCALFGEETRPDYDFVGNVPRRYEAPFVEAAPVVDGRLDDATWRDVPWTEEFVDIRGTGHELPRYATRVKMCWDDEYFYVGAWLVEPHVWGTIREHDAVIFQDNDFEVFIDPDGDARDYYEYEINALGTDWDLRLVRPYRDGGPALNEWEIPGMQSAVHVEGTLNRPGDLDRGWSVELAFPWKVLAEYANKAAPPFDGDVWRINFSRVQWQTEIVDDGYRKIPEVDEDNWTWSPQFEVDMHQPEQWGYVTFVRPEGRDAGAGTGGRRGRISTGGR